MKPGAIRAEGVSRRFRVAEDRNVTLKEAIVRRKRLRRSEIWALRDISLSVEPGEAVGLIGRNGSGKTTLLRLIAGIFKPTAGDLRVGGSVGALLGIGAGFHQDFTGRENVYMNGAIHGLKRRYIDARIDDIVHFAELERFIDVPVRTYSTGMYMRLGFAIAAHLDPDILLLDEVFAVGDEAFQRKSFAKVRELKDRGRTIVFVSHAAPVVERLCERTILLREGRIDFDGASSDAIARYHRLLAEDEAPAERAAGLREWGSGEVLIAGLRLEGGDGEERGQFMTGATLVVRLRVRTAALVPPPRFTIELRDANGSLLGANDIEGDELGWDPTQSEAWVQFEVPRLALADGVFQLALAVTAADGRNYHRIDPAASFTVFRDDATRGWFRFDGEWTLVEERARVESA